MENFGIFDNNYSERIYMFRDYEVEFHNHIASVLPSIAYHMARTMKDDEFIIEKKFMPFNPDSWRKEKRIVWGGNFASANGFGMVAENTVKWLRKMGVNCLTYGGLSGNPLIGAEFVDPIVMGAFDKEIIPDCIEIQHVQPPTFMNSVVERRWMYSMFETTHTPKSWIKMLNNAEHLLVPSSWLVDSWHEQGVTKPIDVIGHGIDPEFYYYMERPERDTFTFVHYCQMSIRKGTDLVVKAFEQEFKDVDDVRLILKNVYPFFPCRFGIPKVEYIAATFSKEEMQQLLLRSDCMVFPTRGEGFGLPPFEAMATGLPTIVTNWGGTADFVNKEDTLLLEHTMDKSVEFDMIYEKFYEKGENSGQWAEPNFEQLKSQMRWAYEHRSKAMEMGKKAAERIKREWTWEVKIKQLYDIIDKNV